VDSIRTLTKLIFALVLAAIASSEVVAQTNSDLPGAYLFRFEWGGERIVLKNNGTYTSESSGSTQTTTESGPYSVAGNVIRFTPRKLTIRAHDEKKEHDLTKPKARKKYLSTDEPFKSDSWELQVVRWGERTYLISRKWLGSLVEAINLGFEPRSVDGYRAHYGEIYLREGDEIKRVTGPPPLPEELLRDLLPAPVIATVLELKSEGGLTVAIIDRGSADGLKQDMWLVPVIATMFYESYRIKSITEHTAEVYVLRDVNVGDQLSTRVPDVLRYAE
jgi:hypothetical protein